MGATNSTGTRKLTLVDDEKAGVIKLSESLAIRLRGRLESDRHKESLESASVPTDIQPPSVEEQLRDKDSSRISFSEDGIPWSNFTKETNFLISKLQEEKELALKYHDQEWRNKLNQREKEYTNLANLTEDHMHKSIKEVEQLFKKVSCTPVCQEQQEKVLNCYRKYPKQSLRCSEEVEHFVRCVNLGRLQSSIKDSGS